MIVVAPSMDDRKTSFFCQLCQKTFCSQSSLKRHLRSVHSEKPRTRPVSVNCPICSLPSEDYQALLAHLSSSHGLSMKEEAHDFLRTEDFMKWKEALENATDSRFVKLRGTAAVKSVRGKKDIYVCHRSGKVRQKDGKRLRHCKKQGSKKINAFCPARMKVITTEGDRVFVNFLPTHVGHSLEGAHLTLSRSDKEMLLKKIVAQTPFEDILAEVHRSDLTGRLKLLTKKDLLNIIRDVKLVSSVFCKNDLTEWVRSQENSVLLYKPCGTLIDGEESIGEEDFIVCLVSSKYFYLLGSMKYISLDSYESHSMDEYNLYSIAGIVDKVAVECAAMITNRKDVAVLELFLKKVALTQNLLKPKIIFHDNGVFFKAWASLFGLPDLTLNGTWHMDREWRDVLTIWLKNKPVEKHELFKALKSLMSSKDVVNVDGKLSEISGKITTYCESNEVEEYFCGLRQRARRWAPSYRALVEHEVNGSFERLHRTIKCIYSYFKSNQTLEFMASSIVDIMQRSVPSKIDKVKDIRQMHAAATKLSHNILLESENLWKTWANEEAADVHVVKRLAISCLCPNKCPLCQTCQNCYQCSCPDYQQEQTCVHLHLICMNLEKFNDAVEMATINDVDSDEVIVDDLNNGSNDEDFNSILTMITLDDVKHEFETDDRGEVVELISEAVTSEELEDGKLEIQQQFGNILNMISSLEGVNVVKNAFSLIIPTLKSISSNTNVLISNNELSD